MDSNITFLQYMALCLSTCLKLLVVALMLRKCSRDQGHEMIRSILCLASLQVIPLLKEQGYRVIALDFIGSGRSDKLIEVRRL